uniref:Uncharacterized protein n=1 Tax=Romanomermis culicivorax TaxID=13658 RepID=A0A915JWC6_ROMCU
MKRNQRIQKDDEYAYKKTNQINTENMEYRDTSQNCLFLIVAAAIPVVHGKMVDVGDRFIHDFTGWRAHEPLWTGNKSCSRTRMWLNDVLWLLLINSIRKMRNHGAQDLNYGQFERYRQRRESVQSTNEKMTKAN